MGPRRVPVSVAKAIYSNLQTKVPVIAQPQVAPYKFTSYQNYFVIKICSSSSIECECSTSS